MAFLKAFKSIKISNPAEIDLKNISSYTLKHWGKLQKKNYIGQIKKLFLGLSHHDEAIMPLIIERDEIDKGLLSYRINQHVLFFRETEQEILIVKILHSRMDTEKHLYD